MVKKTKMPLNAGFNGTNKRVFSHMMPKSGQGNATTV